MLDKKNNVTLNLKYKHDMIYKFIITTDEVANFSREIEINSDATFLELNDAILDSVNYTKDQITSFFSCGRHWNMETEITLTDMDANPENDSYLMEHTFLDEFVKDEGDRLIFVFDQILERAFYIKLEEIKSGELDKAVCTHKEGNAPKQESTDDDIMNHLNTPSTSSIIDDSFYGDSEFDSEELDAEGFSDFDSNDLY